jgi:predicted Ser/Thr protein kinase
LLAFEEYLELFAASPVRYTRDAARYLRDVFDHYGRSVVKRPWGERTRFSLFDLAFLKEGAGRRHALVGQENVQREIYRALSNFVREGRANRLLLLNGPNGSAKSTVAACIMAALEHYSSLDEGALYRFHWVFPTKSTVKGAIGFAERARGSTPEGSYAHLPDDEVDARLFMEVRDHPLFLVPAQQRGELVRQAYGRAGVDEPPGDWILRGNLSHKNRLVFDALLTSYEGNLEEVLRHVQVERFFISRRYRMGAVTIGPQLTVDAGERQVTADRSLGALPSALQAVTLFEAFGELVEAGGGLLEFSDLLKRPLDAIKYLQLTVETGDVPLRSQNLPVNCVMIGSANEGQLAAFREHPEFESFRGRLELIRAPYLTSWVDEQAIYDAQIAPQVRRHVAPHATRVAAMFAVLTRLRRPNAERYEKPLRKIVEDISAMEKLDMYGTGATPERLEAESSKTLRAAIAEIHDESDSYPIYEGSVGASPREMRSVLLDAAQDLRYECLSPFAVLTELERLCEKTSEYIWLQQERQPGGYHDHSGFREALRERLLDLMEDEFRVASGLVDDARYQELFEKYIIHVSYSLKGEKLLNHVTGAAESPDERLMNEVEDLLGVSANPEEHRHSLTNSIAAWAIDHPDEKIDSASVFSAQLKRLRDAVFGERRPAVTRLCRELVILLRADGEGLDESQVAEVRAMYERLTRDFGYAESSAADAAAALVRERFSVSLG